MPTLERSRALAESLVAVANGAGLQTGALITDMNEPLATAAGNALEMPQRRRLPHRHASRPRLCEVTLALCAASCWRSAGSPTAMPTARRWRARPSTSGKAAEHFSRMVARSAARPTSSTNRWTPSAAAPIVRDVGRAGRDGFVAAIDTRGARHRRRRARRRPPPRRPTRSTTRRLRPPRRPRRRGRAGHAARPHPRARRSDCRRRPRRRCPRRLHARRRAADAPAHRRADRRGGGLMPRAILLHPRQLSASAAPPTPPTTATTGANTLGHIAAACAEARDQPASLRTAQVPNWTPSASARAAEALDRHACRAASTDENPRAAAGASAARSRTARTRPPATGRSPASRCPSTGAISRRPTRPSRPS